MPDEHAAEHAGLDAAAEALPWAARELPPRVRFSAEPRPALAPLLAGVRVGLARDAAFCFVYEENLALLRELGAELVPFSPRDDARLPDVDALYLPGGYPELHAEALARNATMRDAVLAHVRAGKPTVAECGGMMYLGRSLTTVDGAVHAGVGALAIDTEMQRAISSIGHYEAALPEGTLRGHAFHCSTASLASPVELFAKAARFGRPEPILRERRLLASYVHWYFPSNPEATARLFSPRA
jgi:cobyrinic acid a,c-diamide synthase